MLLTEEGFLCDICINSAAQVLNKSIITKKIIKIDHSLNLDTHDQWSATVTYKHKNKHWLFVGVQ